MTRPTLASTVAEVSHWPPLHADRSLFPRVTQAASRTEAAPTSADLERAAYKRGVSDGLASAQREIGAAMAANEEYLQQALAHERLRLLDGEGQRLAATLVSTMTSLENSIVEHVGPVLRQIIEASLFDRAMTEFIQILHRAVSADGAQAITITCSSEMIALVKSYLPPDWNHAKFVEGLVPGIQVVAGDVDMRVDLEAWRQLIARGAL